MSEAKFTSSEWVVDVYPAGAQVDVVSECGRKTLHCNKRYFSENLTDEDLANAHLIAAAPEMYEMLEKIAKSTVHDKNYATAKPIFDLLAKARGEQ